MRVLSPKSLDEALHLLASERAAGGGVRPIAGGTDLLVSWHHQPKDDLTLLDLSGLREQLRPYRLTDDYLELGALTTYWEIVQARDVAAAFPLLAQAAQQVGAVQIQTRGTWAGNIGNGSPAADGVLALLAYAAVVVLQSEAGQEEVPLDDYFTGYKQTRRQPDQLLVAIRIPRRLRALEWFHKVGARAAQAISKVGVAVVKDDAGWRVAANSVAPYVCRCRSVETALEGGRRFRAPREIRRVLEADVAPIDDIRSTAEYRITVLSRLLYFWLLEQGLAD